MYHDDRKYNQSVFMALAWMQKLEEMLPSVVQEVGSKLGIEAEYEDFAIGSFNLCYRLIGSHNVIRFPILCKSAFRYEKTDDERRTMRCISQYTSIPIPKVLAVGNCDMGPYLVLSLVDGTHLSEGLKAQLGPEVRDILNPDIDLAVLSRAYRNMARVMIELSRCKFTRIGAIGQDTWGDWSITKRPVTMNMNELVSCGNYPPKALPQEPFTTANAYFTALAEMHINHLRTQRNDAVDDEADCRQKYVARHLFLKLARTYSTKYNDGPFSLYCDDFRPGNVIVDPDMNIKAVIDREYCYTAPAEMTFCPPFWLLLRRPHDWDDGDLGVFWEQYLPRCRLFIEALRIEEDKMIRQVKMYESERLSNKMAQSLENGNFWFCLAATSSFAFDDIYWKFIDPLYYGKYTSIEDRIQLLSLQEQDELEPFVELKMRQAEEAELDEHTSGHEMFTA